MLNGISCFPDLRVDLVKPYIVHVNENNGTIDLCVTKNFQTIEDVTLGLQYTDYTASGNGLYDAS